MAESPTAVYNPNISTKRLAREIRHVAHVVAEIPKGKKPMEDGGPDGDPAHELGVQGDVMSFYYIKDGVVEQGYQTRDADDSQRLGAYGAEDHASQCRGEEGFVYAVETTGAIVHVKDKR